MRTYLQHKGSQICLDFDCDCGVSSHFDDDFCYYIQCPGCKNIYKLGESLSVELVKEELKGGIVRVGKEPIYRPNSSLSL